MWRSAPWSLETLALRRERDLLRDHFAAIVSHELKAPLAAIQQNIFVLEHDAATAATPEQRERLARVKARMADLIQMVDTWRRGVSTDLDAIKARQVPVSVRVPIDKAVESALVYATRKAVAIEVAVPEPAPRVLGDQGTLTEAVVNILGNAVKFSRDGGRIEVTAEAKDDDVRIVVADHGVGIAAGRPAARVRRLLHPARRGRRARLGARPGREPTDRRGARGGDHGTEHAGPGKHVRDHPARAR